VLKAGLLDRAYAYYSWRAVVSFLILAVGVALAGVAAPLAAVVIAFGSIQVTLIGHDAGHQAVFRSRKWNDALGSLCWSLIIGISFYYWNDRHTRHHTLTNDTADDPDLQFEFGAAFTPLMAFTFRYEGWRFAMRELSGRKQAIELSLVALSTMFWLAPVLVLGPAWLLTLVVSQILASMYLAGVVAPNHVGMPIWPAGATPSFLERQVRSSRNVVPNWFTDFVFGGLNYQIEHHLFPNMPRNHFSAARALVRPFCAERGLPYAESGMIAVYREVISALPRHQRAHAQRA
jgi:fatty acid desaturase